jgi:hypothetical protein
MDDQPRSGETIREYLDRRERELIELSSTLHNQLQPLEAELAEVRRAKGALGISSATFTLARAAEVTTVATASPVSSDPNVAKVAVTGEVPPASSVLSPTTWQPQDNFADAVRASLQRRFHAAALAATQKPEGYFVGHSGVVASSPYLHLTMKELVTKALTEHFHDGATAKQLREFFRDAWGRNIERANLSPQLSRLKGDGTIQLDDETGIWSLARVELTGRAHIDLGLSGPATVIPQSNQASEHEKNMRAREASQKTTSVPEREPDGGGKAAAMKPHTGEDFLD